MTTADMLAKLVGFNTISDRPNIDLVIFVEAYLNDLGVQSTRVPSPDGTYASLYFTVGPKTDGGIVLSGHTDVVPVAGQDWSSDPFTLVKKGNRFYGRGTADMKGFVATCLAKIPAMLAADLKRPFHFALTYDEEIGCLKAPELIDHMKPEIGEIEAVIVGEPSNMETVIAHKGIMYFDVTITGKEAHSSQTHRGVSAVMIGAKLISFIDDLAKEMADTGVRVDGFVPSFTTLHCGMFSGGAAHNIIARHASFGCDIRTVPGQDADELLARIKRYARDELVPGMQKIAAECDIVFDVSSDVPPLSPERETRAPFARAENLVNNINRRNASLKVPYAAEAGQFQRAGFSTVICGPGDIAQAHRPDEFIEIAQLELLEQMLDKLIVHLSH